MTANQNNEGILPVITVKVEGIIWCALIDTGAGCSYASAKLLDPLKKKPTERKTKCVNVLISSQVTKLGIYDTVKTNKGQ